MFILHGDLHHENILRNNNHWIAIDPKGIIGEIEFEVACFDFIRTSEIECGYNIPKLFEERTTIISNNLHLNQQRLKDWVFVRLVLGACGAIEDNAEASIFLNQISHIFPK